jgi:hypothetical protein
VLLLISWAIYNCVQEMTILSRDVAAVALLLPFSTAVIDVCSLMEWLGLSFLLWTSVWQVAGNSRDSGHRYYEELCNYF